jgi:O-antigen/teichoic acid export membrane protein
MVANRASPRAAFTLRVACMGAGVVLSLVWTRALLHALGAHNFGLYSSFMAFLAVAGAAEFGMGGAVCTRTTQLIAAGDTERLAHFHAVARTVFLIVGLSATLLCLALSPWLPGWLHFGASEGRGSIQALFATGALSVSFAVFFSYLNNASYGAGPVTWAILPNFLIVQIVGLVQVSLAWLGAPLWVLQAGTFLCSVGNLWVMYVIVRHSQPVFARPLPIRFEWKAARALGQTSFWFYLFGLFTIIYSSTDRLIINAWFGAESVATFHLNNRLPELALSVVTTVTFVGVPRMLTLLLGSAPEAVESGRVLLRHLAQAQSFLAMAAVLFYLLCNDFFVRWVFGPASLAPLGLQFAFGAAVLLVANADIYFQVAVKLSDRGLRLTALTLLGTGLLNFVLSLLCAKYLRWFEGVAWSTCAAQLLMFFVVTLHLRRRIAFRGTAAIFSRSLIIPLAAYALACWGKLWLGRSGPLGFLSLAGLYAVFLAIYSLLLGPTPAELWRHLLASWRQIAKWRKPGDPPAEPPPDTAAHPASLP